MNGKSRPVIQAILAMVGTIIGAGIFALPEMYAKTGILIGSIIFWIVAVIVLATHLLYVEVIARDPVRRRLPGHVAHALGKGAGWLASLSHAAQHIGAQLAYLLLGGSFLALLVKQISGLDLSFSAVSLESVLQVAFWLVASLCVLRGLKIMARIEAVLTWALMVTIAIIILAAIPYAGYVIFPAINTPQILAPLGVFLFALFGISAIPEVHEMAGRKIHLTRTAVLVGSLVAALLTWLFGLAYYTIQEVQAQGGFGAFDGVFSWVVPIVGFLAVITSYLTIAYDLQASFIYDLKLKPLLAQTLTLGAPLLLFFLGVHSFLTTVDIVGAVFAATNGVFVVLMANRLMSRDARPVAWWWRVGVPIVTALALAATVFQKISSFIAG